jgi:hypothetical protein
MDRGYLENTMRYRRQESAVSHLGLVSNLVSMAVLILNQFFMAYHNVAYGLLLGAMAALVIGFGTTLTAIQT